jgi:hypothetical protein
MRVRHFCREIISQELPLRMHVTTPRWAPFTWLSVLSNRDGKLNFLSPATVRLNKGTESKKVNLSR